jgi:hypothetical protein
MRLDFSGDVNIMRLVAVCGFSLCVSVLVVACSSVKVTTSKSPDVPERPKNLFVVESFGTEVFAAFQPALEEGLRACGVNTKFFFQKAQPANALPVPDAGLVAEIRADALTFHPDSILLVSETSYTTINGSLSGSRYSLSLQDLASKNEIWKGNATLRKDHLFVDTATVAADLAKQIIDELQQNGLVSCTAPGATQVPKGTSDSGENQEKQQ